MKPALTVIIPVLNGMPYLPEMLASLAAQTFRDFEVVLWDNGSTDGTVAEAEKWLPGRLPGRVVAGVPLPLHECLARMVRESTSELCARMDADDLAHPERFARQVAFLAGHPECDGVGGQMELVNERSEKIGLAAAAPLGHAAVLLTMFWRNAMPHPAMVFRRTAALAAGNYSAHKPVEDYDLWLRMCLRGRLANLPEMVLQYRVHATSVCAGEARAGQLVQKMHECAARHSSALFDIVAPEMLALLARRKFLSVFPLEHLLTSVARRAGVARADLRRTPEFHAAGRAVCHRRDLFTRMYLAILETHARGQSLTGMILHKLHVR